MLVLHIMSTSRKDKGKKDDEQEQTRGLQGLDEDDGQDERSDKDD